MRDSVQQDGREWSGLTWIPETGDKMSLRLLYHAFWRGAREPDLGEEGLNAFIWTRTTTRWATLSVPAWSS